MVSRKLAEAWSDIAGLDLLAVGYATPFLGQLRGSPRRIVAAMPAGQGVEAWPVGAPNCAFLSEETSLPTLNALFDRIVAVHALEESENPLALMREVARVLAPSGRLIVVVSSRHGLWADAQGSPFGQGRPFRRRQIESLVLEAGLQPVGWTRALYVPPLAWMANWAEGFEQVGARIWPPFAGLILMEAVKLSFALRPKGLRARAPARTALRPAPSAGAVGTAGLGLGRRARPGPGLWARTSDGPKAWPGAHR